MGNRQIVVIDPKARTIWSFDDGALRETDVVASRGERTITAGELWASLNPDSKAP